MILYDYIKQFPCSQRVTERQRIAKALGVSESYVRSMCNGNRKIPGIYAIPIERATNGLVTRHETCPHLYPFENESTRLSNDG